MDQGKTRALADEMLKTFQERGLTFSEVQDVMRYLNVKTSERESVLHKEAMGRKFTVSPH